MVSISRRSFTAGATWATPIILSSTEVLQYSASLTKFETRVASVEPEIQHGFIYGDTIHLLINGGGFSVYTDTKLERDTQVIIKEIKFIAALKKQYNNTSIVLASPEDSPELNGPKMNIQWAFSGLEETATISDIDTSIGLVESVDGKKITSDQYYFLPHSFAVNSKVLVQTSENPESILDYYYIDISANTDSFISTSPDENLAYTGVILTYQLPWGETKTESIIYPVA